jgi:hypothetical protein
VHLLFIRVQNQGGRNVWHLWHIYITHTHTHTHIFIYKIWVANSKFWPYDHSVACHIRRFVTLELYCNRSDRNTKEDVTRICISQNSGSDWIVNRGVRFWVGRKSDRMATNWRCFAFYNRIYSMATIGRRFTKFRIWKFFAIFENLSRKINF